jgi:hypothetical protein
MASLLSSRYYSSVIGISYSLSSALMRPMNFCLRAMMVRDGDLKGSRTSLFTRSRAQHHQSMRMKAMLKGTCLHFIERETNSASSSLLFDLSPQTQQVCFFACSRLSTKSRMHLLCSLGGSGEASIFESSRLSYVSAIRYRQSLCRFL